ncbi:cytochrome c biogenesis protein DipZ [Sphingomicrobium flavum]|uniref:cytochrome c biogenesis protein DipZ n=1 Tax=Sphingomicrobium flavum TaxID=1229164 RepID=UPI0021ADF1B9|nr:cytochrome c biogenesis protein DipZ [Sphingomicrobium flavum]
MILYLLAYLGGILTILSPCILPVLPFVLARSDRPFISNGLPMLGGMALAFTAIASLAAVGGEWAVQANSLGRLFALALMAGFALLLLFPSLSERVMRPLVGWGERLSNRADKGGSGLGSSILLGIATGLLWAPCAGPILGLILTGAALSGASAQTALLLLAYALGAATSLAGALLVGGKLYARMKASIGTGEKLRKGLGVMILGAVIFIAAGLDTKLLTRLSSQTTFAIEQGLSRTLGLEDRELTTMVGADAPLPDEGPLPSLDGAIHWLNSEPLSRDELKGKVVLVDFWTYSCINCIRAAPYVQAWHERYADDGLVIIGVHTPEFAFERRLDNVRAAMDDLGLTYPVAIDNDWTIWKAFDNRYWPAHYLADAEGRLRYHHFGEGKYDVTEEAIRQLLMEAGATNLDDTRSQARASAVQQQADRAGRKSPETYLGWKRMERVGNADIAQGEVADYVLPDLAALNSWGFDGRWQVLRERARAIGRDARIGFTFQSRDLHLVLGSDDGKPRRFQILLDGEAPGADAGLDVDEDGYGTVTDHRLYQLVRHEEGARQRTFTIRFIDSGVEAYAFTFG